MRNSRANRWLHSHESSAISIIYCQWKSHHTSILSSSFFFFNATGEVISGSILLVLRIIIHNWFHNRQNPTRSSNHSNVFEFFLRGNVSMRESEVNLNQSTSQRILVVIRWMRSSSELYAAMLVLVMECHDHDEWSTKPVLLLQVLLENSDRPVWQVESVGQNHTTRHSETSISYYWFVKIDHSLGTTIFTNTTRRACQANHCY